MQGHGIEFKLLPAPEESFFPLVILTASKGTNKLDFYFTFDSIVMATAHINDMRNSIKQQLYIY